MYNDAQKIHITNAIFKFTFATAITQLILRNVYRNYFTNVIFAIVLASNFFFLLRFFFNYFVFILLHFYVINYNNL